MRICVDFLGFSPYRMMPSVNGKFSFFFFFCNLSVFNVSFFRLLSLARIFGFMPNTSGENGHLCLISGHCRKHSSLSPDGVMVMVIFFMLQQVEGIP